METVKVTGSFYDVSHRPLRGKVVFTALPEYVVHTPEDAVFAGSVVAELTDDGAISIDLIASAGWSYEVDFQLYTQDGISVPTRRQAVKIPETGNLPDLMALKIDSDSRAPVLTFEEAPDGEIIAKNYRIDPADAGSILVPIQK